MNSIIKEIRDKLAADRSIDTRKKEELLDLLNDLSSELSGIKATHEKNAEKITGNVKRTADEVIKEDKDPDLINKSIDDLKDSVLEFELSHPKLFEKVNNISAMLASMGI